MILFPNAKINIGLNIVAKRPDGYHNIESVMLPTGWCDSLEIIPAKTNITTFSIYGRSVNCPTEKNLVMRAYRIMQREFDLAPVNIYLYKNIPDGAGLGGGSADAAFTIKGLNDLFNLGLSNEQMASIASTIGADCPFFIYNRPMLATGIGTDLRTIDINLSGKYILIAKAPNTQVSTTDAYAMVTPRKADYQLVDSLINLPVDRWMGIIKNDFEESVFTRQPLVGELKQRMLDYGAQYAAMSGSGSAIFGIFENDKMAVEAQKQFSDCDCFVSRY